MPKPFRKFGRVDIVTAGTATVWAATGLYVWPTAKGRLRILSSQAADADEGTGAHGLTLEGLDHEHNLITETLALNGQTPVWGTKTRWYRLFRAYCGDVGSGLTNAGNITIELNGQTVGYIAAGLGQTQLGIYTVPAGSTFSIHEFSGSPFRQANGACQIQLFFRHPNQCWRMIAELGFHTQGPGQNRNYDPNLTIPEKCDLEMRATTSANNTGIIGELNGWLS